MGVTGATGDLGRLLLPRLLAHPEVARVIMFDVAVPKEGLPPRVEFHRADLTRPGIESELSDDFREARLDALYHLAFLNSRLHQAAFAHELEVIGTLHVLAAAGATRLPRLIVPSLTALYGASPAAPAFIRESAPLRGCAGSRFFSDRVEVERQVELFARAQPGTQVIVLRLAALVGAGSNNPLIRWLRSRAIPTLIGHDPLFQLLHEDDAAEALVAALTTRASGAFNIASTGVLPLSTLVQRSGGRVVPLPGPVLRGSLRVLEALGVSVMPTSLLDFVRYAWVCDGARAERELPFAPRHDALGALAALEAGG